MKLNFSIIILILLLVSPFTASSNDKFSNKFNDFLIRHNLPGAVILIKKGEEIIHYQSYGKVNLKKNQLIKKDDIFRIYSMSKPITSVALLQLVDKGKISLQDDIRKFLPEFQPFYFDGKESIVTVHHLLSHTAGFGYGGGLKSWIDIKYLIFNPLSRSNTLTELVEDLSGIDLKFPPGSRFEYSIASDIQGALIEAVTGITLEHYLIENLFKPLNMVDTRFFVAKNKKHRLVDMYEYDADTFEQAHRFDRDEIHFLENGAESEYLEKPLLESGGGGLVSTAMDYSNFVSMLLNNGIFNGQRILSESLTELMLSSKTKGLDLHFLPRIYKGAGFGYGVGVKEVQGDIRNLGSFFWAGMGGTVFWADPVADVQVVAMMQVEDGWIALEKWLIPEVYNMIKADEL